MSTVIFIPARYASTRYPGKPLAALRQPDGSDKTLIQMSWEAASQIPGVDAVYVATDDERIAEAVRGFGGEVVMTAESCENGTARCADALAKLGTEPDLVVNFQGDAPLTPPWFVEDLIAAMKAEPDMSMATPVLRCDRDTYEAFVEDRKNGRVGGTTVVFDDEMRGLYFSKEVLPYIDPAVADEMAQLTTLITSFVDESTVRFITGDRDLAEWDSYISELNRLGLARYLQIYQEAYEEKYR